MNLHQTLSSVKYTADEQAGGWDTVTVTMGRQKGEVPVYIIRRAGAVVLKGRPLERLTVGQILKPDIRLELSPLVRAEDTFSASPGPNWVQGAKHTPDGWNEHRISGWLLAATVA